MLKAIIFEALSNTPLNIINIIDLNSPPTFNYHSLFEFVHKIHLLKVIF